MHKSDQGVHMLNAINSTHLLSGTINRKHLGWKKRSEVGVRMRTCDVKEMAGPVNIYENSRYRYMFYM